MYKLLISVLMLSSLSFGGLVTINLSVPKEGFDHYNASLLSVDLNSYIGAGAIIKSAVLKFDDFQNLREPEANDILHIDLLKLKTTGSGPQNALIYTDDQASTDYFKVNPNTSKYSWVAGKSSLLSYTDNNDTHARVETKYGVKSGTQSIGTWSDGWYYYGYDNTKGLNGGIWKRVYNYTTEDFDRILDISVVNEFKNSANGWIGIGFDADCHYIGNVSLVVETKDVPEPGSSSLILLGLTSLAGALFIRKKSK